MPVTTYKTIHTANAYLVRQAIEVYDPTSDSYNAVTSGTFTVSFATSSDGSGAIAGLQNLALAPATGEVGTYYRVVQSSTLAALVPYAGQVIYQIVSGGALADLQAVTPLLVTTPRWAQ